MDGLATEQSSVTPMEVTHTCIVETAERFDLPARLIYAVLKVEGGKIGQRVKNTNGTFDMGPMQINTIWLKHFEDYVSAEQILHNGCVNVQIGAWILRSRINEAGGDFWKGVGSYHSKTPWRNQAYQAKVYAASLID